MVHGPRMCCAAPVTTLVTRVFLLVPFPTCMRMPTRPNIQAWLVLDAAPEPDLLHVVALAHLHAWLARRQAYWAAARPATCRQYRAARS